MPPTLHIDHLPGRTVQHDGQEYLFFSGTSYLGLPQHPTYRQLVTDAMTRYGTVFGASRNGNLRLHIYEEAEAVLARFAAAPAALTVSSGMMAGQLVVQQLRALRPAFLYAPRVHPALWHEPAPPIPAVSFGEWTSRLPTLLDSVPVDTPVVLLTNSLDAVRSERYGFDWVQGLPDNRPIWLVVDDSHGLGITGPGGSGIWAQLPARPNVTPIVTASLAKAMGLPGGAVLADADTLADLRRSPFFGACSPIPPAYLAAFVRAEPLYAGALQTLRTNVAELEGQLAGLSLFSHEAGYPVFYTEHDGLYAYLLARQLLIYSFSYPTPADKPTTRVVVSALHRPEDLARLANAVRAFAGLVGR